MYIHIYIKGLTDKVLMNIIKIKGAKYTKQSDSYSVYEKTSIVSVLYGYISSLSGI